MLPSTYKKQRIARGVYRYKGYDIYLNDPHYGKDWNLCIATTGIVLVYGFETMREAIGFIDENGLVPIEPSDLHVGFYP